jgi:chemotaxis protein MotB
MAVGNFQPANAARRVMQAQGIRPDQVMQIRGFADQRLRKPDAPLDPANRRISIIVQYTVKANDEPEPDSAVEARHEDPVTQKE